MGAPKGKGGKGGKGKGPAPKGGTTSKGKGKGAKASGKGKENGGEKWIQVKPTVLVTGCAGYVAASIVRKLVSDGYKVRGTMRSVDLSDSRVAMMKRLFPQVELLEADLLGGEEGFVKAMEGCKYVIHTASPFKLDVKDIQAELIAPALKGTEAVMRAAAKAKISRVVVTSSVAAIGNWSKGENSGKVWTEEDWNDDEPDTPINGYRVSKTLAEKKAWELSKELDVELAVLNPGFVIGPMLSSRKDGESVQFIAGLLDGTLKEKAAAGQLQGAPRPVTDVRDLALAHVRAMEKEEAAGKRILICSDTGYTAVQMASELGDRFKAYPLPTESQEKDLEVKFNNKRTKEILGVSLRPMSVSMRDMASAALRLGVAERKFIKKAAKGFGKVAEILPDSRSVYLLVSVVSIGTPEEGRAGDTITEAVVGDATGLVTVRLNSEEIKALGSVGDVVEIRNGAVKMTKGFIRLIVGKWGKVAKHDGDTTVTPNKAKDVSSTEYELVAA